MADPALTTPEIRALLERLRVDIETALGAKLVGLYLVGSLVSGDFDATVSDIDLIAVLATDADATEFAALGALHAAFDADFPYWSGRIEVIYTTVEYLQGQHADYVFPITSPGEPFHWRDIHHDDWLLNWFKLREWGLTLFGPEPQTLVAPIAPETIRRVIREQAEATRTRVLESVRRPSQAYAILTTCRALYTLRVGTFPSKPQAARWAADQLPEWSALILNALAWRLAWRDEAVDHAATFPETVRFINAVVDLIAADEDELPRLTG